MRRLYMAFAALIAGGMITIGGSAASAQNLLKKDQRPDMVKVQKRNSKAAERLPQTVKAYEWVDGRWVLSHIDYIKYDGSIKKQEASYYYNEDSSQKSRYTTNYNACGKEIESIYEYTEDGGVTWQKYTRKILEYDKVNRNGVILSEQYIWDDNLGDWCPDYEYEDLMYREIERDGNGAVTKSTLWLDRQKQKKLDTIEFMYDKNSQPGKVDGVTSMKWTSMDYDGDVIPDFIYEDIVWYKSDKQYVNLLDIFFNPYSSREMYYEDPNNIILGYNMYYLNDDGTKGRLYVSVNETYDEKGRINYHCLKYSDSEQYERVYRYDVDENGSFEYDDIEYHDYNNNGTFESPSEISTIKTYITYNKYGDITEELILYPDDMLHNGGKDGTRYEYVYNDEGMPTEKTEIWFREDMAAWVNNRKTVFSDYADGNASGIKSVEKAKIGVSLRNNTLCFSNARGAHYIVTDMSGKVCARGVVSADEVDVASLPDGMYIVDVFGRNCNNAVKLIKK